MQTARLTLSCQAIYGNGTAPEAAALAAQAGKKALVLCGCQSARQSGNLDRLTRALAGQGLEYSCIDGLKGALTVPALADLVGEMRARRADVVLALGGGSVINSAKAASAFCRSEHPVSAHLAGEVPHVQCLPMFAIPTLPWNGSELTSHAVIYADGGQPPLVYRQAGMAPVWTIMDPELCVSAPAESFIRAGMDALSHAIEAFTSSRGNAITGALALEAAKRLGNGLMAGWEEESSGVVEAIITGGLMAGMAVETAGLGAVHALAFSIAPLCGHPHGIVASALLPLVMRYNMPVSFDQFAQLSEAWGITARGDAVDQAAFAIRHVMNLTRRHGIPQHLRGLGLPQENLMDAIAEAGRSPFMDENPREYKAEALAAILSEGY